MPKTLLPTHKEIANTHRYLGSDFFIPKEGQLTLQDNTTFRGYMPSWQKGQYTGEVVFNTGMTGYVESLTDPSYTNQILVFTYPLIGNYGVDMAAFESEKIQLSGVVVSEAALKESHARSTTSLLQWLHEQNIPVLFGFDTRALTKHLRSRGTMLGAIAKEKVSTRSLKITQRFVSVESPKIYNEKGDKTVILVDCGAKENIVRSLVAHGLRVMRVPYDYDFTKEKYDGVMLSNGPGDPTDYKPTIAIVKKALQLNTPIFGICLGHQILGLAAGAKTYRLPFGHRGHNQPCFEDGTERAYITSQNHGYAIDEKTLPKDWRVTFRNLNDNSVEGISHTSRPLFAVQFHPEACPGPTDTAWLFEKFARSL